MSFNTVLIKRRTQGLPGAPSSLLGGELAFNEVDKTLYYGASGEILPIAGPGVYVDKITAQTISGDKTFVATTSLSSTAFLPDSVIDINNNVLTNVGTPVLSGDAANKEYVDLKAQDTQALSQALSGYLPLSGGNVFGNLEVSGDITNLNTTVNITSAVNITSTDTSGSVLVVSNLGTSNYIDLNNGTDTVFTITNSGNVGIGTSLPNKELTVVGDISATEDFYAQTGLFSISLTSASAFLGEGTTGTTFFVGDGVVGVNTEQPNTELTISGSVSASNNVYAENLVMTGVLSGQAGVSRIIDVIIDGGSF